MTKTRVLHYLRHLGLGGTEKTCQLFFEHADTSKFDVFVAYEKSGDHSRKVEFLKACLLNGGMLHEVDSWKEDVPNGKSLQKLIHAVGVDILHVYRSGYPEFPENGYHVEVPHCVETNVFGFYDSNPRVDRHLFMSAWLMHDTVKKLGHKPISFDFVNNPVEQPHTDEVLSIAKEWHSQGATIVGRCGRPDNGIYNSVNVDAVKLLRMQGYDVRFMVVAPPTNMLKDLADYDIPFYVIEPTTEPIILSMFYNSIDIFAHTRADGESGGLAIQEAMIHGKPIITHIATPSVPGMGVFQAQVNLVGRDCGFVVNNDKMEYLGALKQLIDDKDMRRNMGQAAHTKALKEFHVKPCMEKLERIYQDVVQKSRL